MTKHLDVNLINGIALAFEGDAVYSFVHSPSPDFSRSDQAKPIAPSATHAMFQLKAQASPLKNARARAFD